MAQLIVVVRILVAECDRMAAPVHHVRQPMAPLARLTGVVELAVRHRQAQPTINLAQQLGTTVRRNMAALGIRLDRTLAAG